MSTAPKKARFKLLIYPKFQLTLLLGNLLVIAGILLSVYISVNRAFNKLYEDGVNAGLMENHAYFEFLRYQSLTILNSIIFAFIAGFIVSAVWMLLLSNKLAGPILRLRGFFGGIARGDSSYPKVSFRKGDFFTELPPLINDALEKIESKRDKNS